MALHVSFHTITPLYLAKCSGDREESLKERSLVEEFAQLATNFCRRLLVSVGSASLVAMGANFSGITSFLLGLSLEIGWNLKLDVVYYIGGYNRCIDANEEFGRGFPSDIPINLPRHIVGVRQAGCYHGAFGFLYMAQSKEPSKTDAGYPLGIGVRNSLIALGIVSVLGFFCTFLVPETRARSLEETSGENEEQEAS